MKDQGRLLAEFDAPSLDQWRAEVERLLKGAPFARKMFTTTLEGIETGSMATAADRPVPDFTATLPGQPPFLRGGRPGAGTWLVAQELPLASPAEFNAALLHDLERGQTAVNLILAGAGPRGTAICGQADLAVALAGVDLNETPVLIQAGAAHFETAHHLLQLADETAGGRKSLVGRVGCDPAAGLASEGALPVPAAVLYDELEDLTRLTAVQAPDLKTLPVFEDPWHDGGADGVLGLGLVLAGVVGVLREMEDRGLNPEEAAPRFQVNCCVGSDFFLEIARLRALRLLWCRLLTACGVDPAAAPLEIHARTSRRTATVLDPHVNMLRATTQAMSAILGGVDSLHVAPFDAATGGPDAFSRRIARNVHLVLAHECHLDHVTDPAGGSWYVEKLTGEVAAVAWAKFQAVEAGGGLMKGLADGAVQEMVAAAADARRARLAVRREVLVGTNQYPDPQPLKESPADGPTVPAGAIPRRRDGQPFEHLRARVEELGRADAAAGRVFVACLGDVARYMPRLEFTRRFFRVGGFALAEDGFVESAADAVAAARRSEARTVVLVGRDDTYADLAAATAAALKKEPCPPRVFLAGTGIDAENIDESINLKSDVLDVLGRLADQLGGAS